MAPDSGLAQAIGTLFILIVLGLFLLGIQLGRILARRLGWSGAKRSLASVGLGAIVAGGFALVVIGNVYYRDIWAPPRLVTFNTPAGFTQHWVILLEDRRSRSVQIAWDGVEMPFFGKKTVIDVHLSGIVRVRVLEASRCCGATVRATPAGPKGRSLYPPDPPALAAMWHSTVFRRTVEHIRSSPTTKRWVPILRHGSVGRCDVGKGLARSGQGHLDRSVRRYASGKLQTDAVEHL
jgi:hypothetical protein